MELICKYCKIEMELVARIGNKWKWYCPKCHKTTLTALRKFQNK